ncbi:MAG: MFS transporter [Elusimicrobiaceae bacterium]|nr:MFS transporter [Elusimicrobiaceae bacterium]
MNKSPWAYIPSLYLAEGFPYIIINTVSVILYGALGYSNEQITLWTGWLYLPWVLKMFWSPLVDARSTKRRWLLGAQTAMSAVLLLIAGLIAWDAFVHAQQTANLTFFTLSLFGFFLGAFVSATLDIATDGYYLLALTPQEQGYFVGIRTIFYRIAMILGSGILVSGAGYLAQHVVPAPYHWVIFFGTLGLFFAGCALYHSAVLPKPEADKPAQVTQATAWKESFGQYFTQQDILYILLFILLYRFGEALLEKIVPLFLLKPVTEGALGISMQDFGLIKGTLGLGAIIAGNLLGGWLLGKFGFKKCIWPFAIALVLPNIFYVYLAAAKPGLAVVAALITLENLGYGLAAMALTVFIMYVSQGKYKTSHYAISTGIMALGMMVPSMLSGKLQAALGYKNFFWLAFGISLITFAIVPLAFKIKAIDIAENAAKK